MSTDTEPRARRKPRLWTWLEGSGDKTSYWTIMSATVALTFMGVVMVLSASSVENIGGAGSYSALKSQGVYAILGVLMMFWLSRWKPQTLRRFAPAIFLLAFVLLVLVLTPLGHEVNGNRNWIRIGSSISFQPSEAAKLALAVWGAHVIALKGRSVTKLSHILMPLVPGGMLLVGLVLIGKDIGTAMVLMLILAGILFMAGIKLQYLIGAGALGLAAVSVIAMSSETRRVRIAAWLGDCGHASDPCFQYDHGIFALASGGWWGVGLGQSRQKWSYIPESENDFIFTILGEELGLIGALAVLALFVVLAIGMFRVAVRTQDTFVRICTSAIMIWLIGQAFMNIAMVTGLLPVIGVPLPFISAGGSALLISLMGVGVVLNFAREERRQLNAAEKADQQNPDNDPGEPASADSADLTDTAGDETTGDSAPEPTPAPVPPRKPRPVRRPPQRRYTPTARTTPSSDRQVHV